MSYVFHVVELLVLCLIWFNTLPEDEQELKTPDAFREHGIPSVIPVDVPKGKTLAQKLSEMSEAEAKATIAAAKEKAKTEKPARPRTWREARERLEAEPKETN